MPAFDFRGRRYDDPVELALEVIGGEWKMPILWRLRDRAWRYGELKRSLGRIPHRLLVQQLRELERDGLIERAARAAAPLGAEYTLTSFGRTTVPAMVALRHWAAEFRDRTLAEGHGTVAGARGRSKRAPLRRGGRGS
jgi:DNA-binding HxlR family transcriptional regulator